MKMPLPGLKTAGIAAISALVLMVGSVVHATETTGSATFDGSAGQYLNAGASPDWSVGTGDFTVEWFQYLTSTAYYGRVFSIGSYQAGVPLAFSIEGVNAYVWVNNGFRLATSTTGLVNQWVHVAITRSGTDLRLYFNGENVASTSNSLDIQAGTYPLIIGRELSTFTGTCFAGNVTNFHFVKGTALYSGSSTFTPPSSPIQPVANTKLLLKFMSSAGALDDSSLSPHTVTAAPSGSGPGWSAADPWTASGAFGAATVNSCPATTFSDGGQGGSGGGDPSGTPGAPSLVNLKSGNRKVQLTWQAPNSDGGSAITGYEVEYRTSSGAWTAAPRGCSLALTSISTSTSCDLTGLSNLSSYYFHVRAINANGAGTWSDADAGTPTFPGVRRR